MADSGTKTNVWAQVTAGLTALLAVTGSAWAEATPYPGDAGQAIAAIAVFVVLLAILGKWAWGPIVHQLQRREETINAAIENAAKREKEAEKLLAAYRDRLEAAESEARQMMAEARREAGEQGQKILAEAREDARQAARRAEQDIERAKRQALTELQETTARLATDIAAQVLRDTLTDDVQEQLMQESLHEIRRRAAKET